MKLPLSWLNEYVKVEDDLSREYQTTSVAPVKEKVAAYRTAAEAIATADDYDAAMALREEALTAANALRAREKAEQTEAIAAVDEALAADPEIVAVVKKAVQDKIDAATAAFDAFKTESNLTDESYQAAVALIQTQRRSTRTENPCWTRRRRRNSTKRLPNSTTPKIIIRRFNGW